MKYIATIIDDKQIITREFDICESKKELAAELRRNGYKVRGIWTPAQYDSRVAFIDKAGASGARNITQAKKFAKWNII